MAVYAFGASNKGQCGIDLSIQKKKKRPAGRALPLHPSLAAAEPDNQPSKLEVPPLNDPATHVLSPTLVEELKGTSIERVCCGDEFSVAVARLGDVYVWGRGNEGQLGNGGRTKYHDRPSAVQALRHERVVEVAAGSQHIVAVTQQGRLYIWGKLHRSAESDDTTVMDNLVGMVGMKTKKQMVEESMRAYFLGSSGQSSAEGSDEESGLSGGSMVTSMRTFTKFVGYYQVTPKLQTSLLQYRIVSVAAGYAFTVAVSSSGQLGLGHRCNMEHPQEVSLASALSHPIASGCPRDGEVHTPLAAHVACGQQHVLLLSRAGFVFSWGLNVFGQLGHGDTMDRLVPTLVEELAALRFKDDREEHTIVNVSCGAHHSMALTSGGRLFSWGHGEYGQHGGSNEHVDWSRGEAGENYHHTPRPLLGLDVPVAHVSCGTLHNCAISTDGDCFTWGWGANGQLGHGSRKFHLVPRRVDALHGTPVHASANGWKHTLIIERGSASTYALAFEHSSVLNGELFADVSLRVERSRQSIFAHKGLLRARCTFLHSMLSLEQRFCHVIEGKRPEIVFPADMACHATLLAFVRYLYTDQLKVAPHLVLRLMHLADRMGVRRLVQLCARDLRVRGVAQAALAHTGPLRYRCDGEKVDGSSFADDMRMLLQQGIDTDFELLLGGPLTAPSSDACRSTTIPVHRAILYARSSYFRTMMESGFLESSGVHSHFIGGVSHDVMLKVIEFLYSGSSVCIDPSIAVGVLAAADRFMMEELKQMCEQVLEDGLDVDNEIGDSMTSPRLRRGAKELLLSSKEALEDSCRSEAFADVRENYPALVREIDHHAARVGLAEAGEVLRAVKTNPFMLAASSSAASE